MRKKVFEEFGCYIVDQNGKLFICYDSGESAGGRLVQNQISPDQARRAMQSENDAHRVILDVEHNVRVTA